MYNEALAERIRPFLAVTEYTERKMFGGLAFLIGGNMAVGVIHDDLLVRTGPDHYDDALARAHARPMDFTGRPSRGMVMVAPEGQDDLALRGWVELGISIATSLPAKPPK